MANVDRPSGFTNPQTDHGGPPRIRKVQAAGTAIGAGDALQWSNGATATGKVIPLVDAQVDICGVAAAYNDGTDTSAVYMYDDLKNTTFEAQTDDATYTAGTLTIADVGTKVDVKVTTLDTTRLTSKHEIMSSTDDAQFLIEEIVDRADNNSALVNGRVRGRFVKITQAAAAAALA